MAGINTKKFQVELNNIKFIIFDKLEEATEEEVAVYRVCNIITRYTALRNIVQEKVTNGFSTEVHEDFRRFIYEDIIFIFSSFVVQWESNGTPTSEEETTRYQQEYKRILHLSEVFNALVDKGKKRAERIGYRRYQVHPVNRSRRIHGFFETYIPTLAEYDDKFKQFTRMSQKQFRFLLNAVRTSLQKCETFRSDVISPGCRLLITLNYLSQGEDFCDLATFYEIAPCTARIIIKETCEVIWVKMSHLYIQFPVDLEEESRKWETLNFPHCFGAVDGKHVRIEKPANSGSEYFNYKKYFSIILMGVCDAEKNFIYAGFGIPGSHSDADVWRNTNIGKALNSGQMIFPPDAPLPDSNIDFGHFLIGDNAFPLTENFLKPYGGRNLTDEQIHFNESLSSARNTIETTFGMLANQFKVFRKEIKTAPEFATKIVQCCVALFNYIKKTADADTPRISLENSGRLLSIDDDCRGVSGRAASEAIRRRDIYKDYLWTHRRRSSHRRQ
uniref:Putative nuclease harbi1 rhagoletis zephyria n=1 Tax=Lutzomyia longipalpis TaxID=7200 RepID=A0A1B0GI57_LUTLO